MRLLALYALCLAALVAAIASVSAGTIKGRVELGDLPAANLLVKCSGSKNAFVRKDGSFVLRDVEPGVHDVSVLDSLRLFTRAFVEIDETGKQVRVIEILPPAQPNTAPVKKESRNLVLRPLGMIDYFEKRQQMSVSSMLMNPMLLLMLFTLGVGVIMPKMMDSLDPEELKQMQQQMAQQQSIAADPSKALASLLSGGAKKDGESDDK